jgi:alkylhydroperoxidase family enzyme
MARISLHPPATLTYRIGSWVSRRKYGVLAEPGAAIAHNPRVLRAIVMFELQVQRWRGLSHELKDLAVLAAAASIGCSWCLDFGYWMARTDHAVPAGKLRAVPAWRDSAVFTELERLVMEYAEAMTQTPPTVTDELVARLAGHFSEAQLVELTAIIAVENQRSRINTALGLTSQGFRDRCDLADVAAAGRPAQAAGQARK